MPPDHLSVIIYYYCTFDFIINMYKWASYAKSKHDDNEPLTSIYYKIDKSKLEKFGSFLEKNRSLLLALRKYKDLHPRANNS